MKNTILIFLLGIFVTISIAATVPNTFMTIKPALPKYTVCSGRLYTEDVMSFVVKYTEKGYITKTCVGDHLGIVVIMEKY